ncbi:M56 family metallopeptidase [Nonomuraea jiangxiensis]|uniref:Zn-dependent protease with chaperone function n=1 Tax=Nonomuraea jiangxiensis TaxID=633440 RepID=A0A1G9ISE0_9ACTN|nr:M56 family metallopeptidase [Nonomuraea jiangxiensis]SDL27946.1 Zn-dependent protease with chaperone function [Nonomuraea jiangxiensis]
MIAWVVAAGVALLPVLLGDRAARRLAGAAWTHRCPRAALVLWQAIGLSAGLGAVGLGLVGAVAPLAAVFPHGGHTLALQIAGGDGLEGLGPVHLLALTWSVGLMSWLLLHTARITTGTIRERHRQRLLVDVVADHSPVHDAYVLPVAEHVAYCVPGRHRRIVLSRGTLDLLAPQELQAVLAHERAHARGHHDLALLPFVALERAFPWLASVRTARQAVAVLVEMIADDHACRARGPLPLARALVRMASAGPRPGPAMPALADAGLVERLQRLLGERGQPRWVPAAAYSTAGLLVSGPMAVLVAPLVCITL